MRRSTRLAAAALAAALACSLMILGASSAPAAGPAIADYKSQGEARGLDVAFTFTGSLFERLVDLGIPRASSDVDSSAGASSNATASQVWPGTLVTGAAGESFPGYREATYPQETKQDAPDDSHVADTFHLPGVISAGPMTVDTGHIKTNATADQSMGAATTNLVALGNGAPLITVKSLETTSESHHAIDHAEHMAQTVAHGIKIILSPDLIVNVGSLVATARTSSDGASPTADTSLGLTDVTVTMKGTTYGAKIDDQGIHLLGAPPISLPSPLTGNPIPNFIPQDPNQTLGLLLKQGGVQVQTAVGTKTVDSVSSDASLSGLLVTFTGTVPDVFVPAVVDELIYGAVEPNLPSQARKLIERSVCYESQIKPLLPKQITQNPSFPDLPLCVSPQIVPGPGSGVVTTFSIGKVHSASAAVLAENFGGTTTGGTTTGSSTTTGVPFVGTGTTGATGGTGTATSGTTGTPAPNTRPTGLVARLPAAALYGAGLALFVLAISLTMGPSLGRWRASPDL